MTVTSGVVTISKDSGNLIGISIGGGAPLCPCLYIVQVRNYEFLVTVLDFHIPNELFCFGTYIIQ